MFRKKWRTLSLVLLALVGVGLGSWFAGKKVLRLFAGPARPAIDQTAPETSPGASAVPPKKPANLEWPSFRGPDGTGKAADAKPPVKWSEKEGIRWKTPLPGPGSSSPVVAGNRVYVTCYNGYGVDADNPGSLEQLKRHLLCLDRANGSILWTGTIESDGKEDPYRGYITEHGYATNTPAVDGKGVVVFFGKSGVAAFDLQGRKEWQTPVGIMSDERRWGTSSSLLLHENLVIVNASAESRAVIALDRNTGKEVWRAAGRNLTASYSTPALISSNGRTEIIVSMPEEVWGINPGTGKLYWTASSPCGGNSCPAVVTGDGIVYVTGGFGQKGTAAIKVGGKGEIGTSNTLWSINTSSYVPTPVLWGKRLLNVNEDGIAVVINAEDGKVIYEERLKAKAGLARNSRAFYASPILADGRLYAVSRKSGVFVLGTGDKFEQIALNPPLDDTDFNATPAVAGKQLFLRSNAALYCLESP